MAIEKPIYTLISQHDKLEIRDYEPMVVAYTNVSLPYDSALSEGFRRIANYIFGGNYQSKKISMTAPVISREVEQEVETYEVLFVMPRLYDLNDLPEPNDNNIIIEKRILSRIAAIKFGGWATRERSTYYIKKLKNFLDDLNIEYSKSFMIAQYNSPWAIPPFRKNEILVEIEKK